MMEAGSAWLSEYHLLPAAAGTGIGLFRRYFGEISVIMNIDGFSIDNSEELKKEFRDFTIIDEKTIF